jgi:hypothetical protein
MIQTSIETDLKPEYTKAGTLRKRKPKQSILYFTQETEDAILQYLGSEDSIERNKIFNEKINYAFHKLAENIIHTFKFYYTEVNTIDELKHEVVAVLLEKLHLYDQSKGKAYSYFGTIAKRYLINYNKRNYKRKKEKAPLEDVDVDKTILAGVLSSIDREQNLEKVSVLDLFIQYVDENLTLLFPRERDAKVADAILELFRKRENLDILSKKALYIYIREITDAPTPVVTVIIKKLKSLYKALNNRYLEYGHSSDIF